VNETQFLQVGEVAINLGQVTEIFFGKVSLVIFFAVASEDGGQARVRLHGAEYEAFMEWWKHASVAVCFTEEE